MCKSKQQWVLDWDRCHLSCGAVPWAEEWGQGRGSGKFRKLGPGPASEPDGKHRTCWTSQAQLQVEEGPLLRGSSREVCRSVDKY